MDSAGDGRLCTEKEDPGQIKLTTHDILVNHVFYDAYKPLTHFVIVFYIMSMFTCLYDILI